MSDNKIRSYITAGELRAILEACPDDARVVLADYAHTRVPSFGLADLHPNIDVRCIDLDEGDQRYMQDIAERDLRDTRNVRQLVVLG